MLKMTVATQLNWVKVCFCFAIIIAFHGEKAAACKIWLYKWESKTQFALKRTNNYFQIFIEKLNTGGPRYSKGFIKRKYPEYQNHKYQVQKWPTWPK